MTSESKVILVTGASRGLGKYVADKFRLAGHRVVGCARSPKEGFAVDYVKCDITNQVQLVLLSEYIRTTYQKLDAVVNCAAIQNPIGKGMHSPSIFCKTIETNLIGAYNVMFHMEQYMSRPKKFVMFGGIGQSEPRPFYAAYSASKAGQLRMVESLAQEFGDDWCINVVCPGIMHTDMTEQTIVAGPEQIGDIEYANAMEIKHKDNCKRLRRMFDMVEFLIGPNSNHITGQTLSAQDMVN